MTYLTVAAAWKTGLNKVSDNNKGRESFMKKNVLIWLSGENANLLPKALVRIAGNINDIDIVGITGTRNIPVTINEENIQLIQKEHLKQMKIDFVLLSSGDYKIK